MELSFSDKNVYLGQTEFSFWKNEFLGQKELSNRMENFWLERMNASYDLKKLLGKVLSLCKNYENRPVNHSEYGLAFLEMRNSQLEFSNDSILEELSTQRSK